MDTIGRSSGQPRGTIAKADTDECHRPASAEEGSDLDLSDDRGEGGQPPPPPPQLLTIRPEYSDDMSRITNKELYAAYRQVRIRTHNHTAGLGGRHRVGTTQRANAAAEERRAQLLTAQWPGWATVRLDGQADADPDPRRAVDGNARWHEAVGVVRLAVDVGVILTVPCIFH